MQLDLMSANAWLRLKGFEDGTPEYTDIFLDEDIGVYILWIALSDIANSDFSRLLFSKGSHKLEGFNITHDNLVICVLFHLLFRFLLS